MHNGIAREFLDDDSIDGKMPKTSSDGSNGLLIVKIVNEKSTRQGKMFEVINDNVILF